MFSSKIISENELFLSQIVKGIINFSYAVYQINKGLENIVANHVRVIVLV